MSIAKEAIPPTLMILFDGLSEQEIAVMLVAQLGAKRAPTVGWQVQTLQDVPEIWRSMVEKCEIEARLEEWPEEEGPMIMTCTDTQLKMVMDSVVGNAPDTDRDDIADDVVTALKEAGYVKPDPDAHNEAAP